MKKITKKTVTVLVGILTISLVAGNILFAGDRSGSQAGVVAADDVAFISSGFSADTASTGNPGSRATADLVTAEDIEFTAAPFNRGMVASGSSDSGSSQSVVNTTDINFVSNDGTADLVCVVDGSLVSSAQACS